MIPDCSSHQAELPTERESRDVLHEDEPLPGSVRPENEALLIRQEVLGTALVPEMQRAQRRAISGLMFFLSVVGFIFILVIHSVKAQSYNGAGSSGAGSGGGGGGGGSAEAEEGNHSKNHRPARSYIRSSHPPLEDLMHEVDKEAELPAEPPVWSSEVIRGNQRQSELPAEPPVWSSEVIRGNQRQSELPAEPPVWSTRCHLPRGLELPAESSVWSTRPRSPKTAIGVIATDGLSLRLIPTDCLPHQVSCSTSPADAWVTPRAEARAPGGATSAARRGGSRSLQV